MFDATVPESLNAPPPASPFELSDRERILHKRYKDLIAGKHAKDPIVSTTPETIRFMLDYIERTRQWHVDHMLTCHAPPSNATPSTDATT